ncbi:MAG: bifunctional nicotinamidase/pyrazinamidase [Planctomycetota bacterium]
MKSNVIPNGNAFLLIDLQNDFVEGGALAVKDGSSVIPVANQWMARFDWVVATQDWHPPDHASFASQHPELAVGDQFPLGDQLQTVWPDHCVQGSKGAEFVSQLDVDQIDQVIQKGTNREVDSYSGFFDNDRRHSTGLTKALNERGIKHLYVMGLATDYCVKASVLDAVAEGFAVTVIEDGCRGVGLALGDIDRAFHEMTRSGAKVATSSSLSLE